MDIKEEIEKLVNRITKDPALMEQFKKDPKAAVEGIVKTALPKDVLDKLVAGVQAKIGADKVSDAFSSLKKLF